MVDDMEKPMNDIRVKQDDGISSGPTTRATSNKLPHGTGYRQYCSVMGTDPEKEAPSFEQRVRKTYRNHTWQYWFVATLANGLLWTQIAIGAVLTALGASSGRGTKTATIYLGAANTIIAGLLTYFKSRNQPNRVRQFRQALRNVVDKMDQAKADLKSSDEGIDPVDKAHEIIKLYDQALADAETNYPDLWVSVNDLKRFFPTLQLPTSNTQPTSGVENDGNHDDEAKTSNKIDQHSTNNNVGPPAAGQKTSSPTEGTTAKSPTNGQPVNTTSGTDS